MGCSESKTKQEGKGAGEAGQGTESTEPAKDPSSPAVQIANASPPKSAMKKHREPLEPAAATPTAARGSAKCEGRVGSVGPAETDDVDESALMDRSFVKEDLTGSFHNLSFISEKGDCRIEKGIMAPSVQKIPASSSDKGSSKPPSETALLSPHSSDGELVLVCMDCGREIDEKAVGQLCPVTAKLHG